MSPAELKAVHDALMYRSVVRWRVGRITPVFTKLLCKMPRSQGPYTLRERTVLALSQSYFNPENRALLEEFLAMETL